jgi:predicted PurR-regulated permease PerM
MKVSRPAWSGQTKILVVVIALIGLVYLATRFSAAITPLVLGCILAFILAPAVRLLQRRLHLKRWLAILIMYLILLLAIAGILMILIPMLVTQVKRIDFDLQENLATARTILSGQVVILGQTVDLHNIYVGLAGTLQGMIQPAVGRTLDFVARFLSSLVWVVLTFVISFYLVKDSHALNTWLEGLAPPGYKEDFIRLREEINLIWSAFFRSQLLLAVVVTIIQTTVCLLLGLRFGLLLGLLAGLLEFVPSFGHSLWFLLAGLDALLGGSMWFPLQHWVVLLILAGADIIFAQFDLNYLNPRIVGRRIRLPPLVVILGILAGAAIAGVLGVLLASPTIASLRVIGRYVYALLFDLEPFPGNTSPPVLPPPELRWWQKHSNRLNHETK